MSREHRPPQSAFSSREDIAPLSWKYFKSRILRWNGGWAVSTVTPMPSGRYNYLGYTRLTQTTGSKKYDILVKKIDETEDMVGQLHASTTNAHIPPPPNVLRQDFQTRFWNAGSWRWLLRCLLPNFPMSLTSPTETQLHQQEQENSQVRERVTCTIRFSCIRYKPL